ncbi:MAG: pyridoxine 5'-phosphate synthase [Bacteroidales bacterium]|nr:pyridoxine 5'-phosphate synthase [Bacteroidales bacterium]
MAQLSVNINKIATIRNARGGNTPDVLEAAIRCQDYGAQGITVHPRPDERHIKYQDVRDIKPNISTEFNIEGYPTDSFISLVLEVIPHQVTLVPDPPDAITSNEGWNTKKHLDFLKKVVSTFHSKGIRTSLFVDTNEENIIYASKTGTNRVELYTEPYAIQYVLDPEKAVKPYTDAAIIANNYGLEVNAGHDLDLNNLKFFCKKVPFIEEVSIGHALISDSLYYGLENTIQMYLRQLK